jgi:hypothetical protein
LNLHATTKAGKFATLRLPSTKRFYQSLRPGARWLSVRCPKVCFWSLLQPQDQAARVRVRAEIQHNPGAVADPTPNFVTPQVTAPQQQLMIQRLLESGESGQLPP